jgi:hypothetical protein
MDFDDMPDSYFAFLSNQRKLAEPDKINGAVRDLGGGDGKKVRSRASQPNLSSKPSVPSLPSIQRTSTAPAPVVSGSYAIPQSGANKASGSKPPSRPGLGPKPASRPPGMMSGGHPMPGNSLGFAQMSERSAPPVTAPSRSNALVFVLIAILLVAIGVLAYLVMTK